MIVRRGLVAGVAVLVLASAAVGIAAAQATPTPNPNGAAQVQARSQAFLDALAKRLNISTSALQQAISGARTDVGLPAGNTLPGFGRGPGGRGPGGFGGELDAAAQAIGISAQQLRQELPGKSLAQVAQAHGKNPADVATAMKNAAHQRIDQAQSAGKLTADQATQRKQQVDQRIDQMLNQVVPQGGPRGPRGAGAEDQEASGA
jgi:DNA-binding transcriptional regulator YdaS (Cro superfamily)